MLVLKSVGNEIPKHNLQEETIAHTKFRMTYYSKFLFFLVPIMLAQEYGLNRIYGGQVLFTNASAYLGSKSACMRDQQYGDKQHEEKLNESITQAEGHLAHKKI